MSDLKNKTSRREYQEIPALFRIKELPMSDLKNKTSRREYQEIPALFRIKDDRELLSKVALENMDRR